MTGVAERAAKKAMGNKMTSAITTTRSLFTRYFSAEIRIGVAAGMSHRVPCSNSPGLLSSPAILRVAWGDSGWRATGRIWPAR